jgi:hypothetical protein
METGGDAPLPGLLAEGIAAVSALHAGTCDLRAPGTPAATVVMARFGPGTLDYLVLGDSTLVIDHAGRPPRTVTDRGVDTVAVAERAAMDALPTGTGDHQAARLRFVGRQRELRNRPGGYWIASTDPRAAAHAVTGSAGSGGLRRVTLLSDGAARFVEFSLGTWQDLLAALDTHGLLAVLARIRAAEDTDPAGARWPRPKPHDDATIVHFTAAS